MIGIVYGPEARLCAEQCIHGDTLWFAVDHEPTGSAVVLTNQHFYSLAALAARYGHYDIPSEELVISTINGFGGPAQRPLHKSDHTPETLAFARAYMKDPNSRPDQIIISRFSAVYDRALAAVAGTVNPSWTNKAVDLVTAFAGSALTHITWNLHRSGIPTLLVAWDTPSGKKMVPHLPRGVTSSTDLVYTDEEFDALEWIAKVQNVRASRADVRSQRHEEDQSTTPH